MIWERALAENAWEIESGLYRILLPLPWAVPFVNAFLVTSQSDYLLIDCGANWLPSLRALGRALKAIGVPSRGLNALLLTHRHPDHAGGAGSVQQRWGGRVLAHHLEQPRRRPESQNLDAWLAQHGVDAEIRARTATPRESIDDVFDPIEPLPQDEPLVVGDLTFEIIHVPGHSPGQVMLREPSRGWLFTADHVLPVQAPNVWLFPDAMDDPFGEYLMSLDRSVDLDADLILPGHGMATRGGIRAMATAMADFHRDFANQVLAALGARRQTGWEVVKANLPDVPTEPASVRFALAEVLAALRYLKNRGEARLAEDGRWVAASASLQ